MSTATRLRRGLRYQLLRILLGAASRLPRRFGLRCFAGLGHLALALRPAARSQILRNARQVLPRWSEARRARLPGRVARHLGRNLFDFVRLGRYSRADLERLVVVSGLAHLERARRDGGGVVCLSAHLGGWELIPPRMRTLGYPVAVVHRRLREAGLERYVAARRGRFGITLLDRDRDARAMLRALRCGTLLGVLPDQRTRVHSVRVPFLGQPAWTPVGPVELALRAGRPVLPLLIRRLADGRHRLTIGPPVDLERPGRDRPAAARAAVLTENLARCNAVIGERIEEVPEQWVWFHARWGGP